MADDTGGIVRSRDGARIAFEWAGQGPPIVLIDTVARSRTCSSLTPLVDLLAPDFTVIQYDRRGRGASTSRRRYGAQCEVDDLAALITAVGGGAHLYGFRSGGLLALQAAAAGLHLSRMVTVDPPALMFSWDSTILAAFCETNARDGRSRRRRDAALERMLLSDGASPDEIARTRGTAEWSAMLSAGRTYGLDCVLRTTTDRSRLASVVAPTLILDTMPDDPTGQRVAQAVTSSIHRPLVGIDGSRDTSAIAAHVRDFLLET